MCIRDRLYQSKLDRKEDLEPSQKQTYDLANSLTFYELLLGYFTFAREGVELKGAGEGGASQFQRTSALMATADVIRELIEENEKSGGEIPGHVQSILQQVTDLSNLARGGLIPFPPTGTDPDEQWSSCLLYTSPSPRDRTRSRMPSSA